MSARYDGLAEWYDDIIGSGAAANFPDLPHIENREDGALIIHPTYRRTGWHPRSPWWPSGGLRDRLGMNQLPLPDLLNAFIDAGLGLDRVYEPREQPIPSILAIRSHRR
jgi:hypothetical protein